MRLPRPRWTGTTDVRKEADIRLGPELPDDLPRHPSQGQTLRGGKGGPHLHGSPFPAHRHTPFRRNHPEDLDLFPKMGIDMPHREKLLHHAPPAESPLRHRISRRETLRRKSGHFEKPFQKTALASRFEQEGARCGDQGNALARGRRGFFRPASGGLAGRPWWSGGTRLPRRSPLVFPASLRRAERGDGTLSAGRRGRQAKDGPELHQGLVGIPRPRIFGPPRVGSFPKSLWIIFHRGRDPEESTGDPSDIRVEYGGPAIGRDGQDRPGRGAAYPGKPLPLLHGFRPSEVSVILRHDPRRTVEVPRSLVVSQPLP